MLKIFMAGAGVALGAWAYAVSKRANDPLEVASTQVDHEPRISTARFEGLDAIDPVTHGAGVAAIREFSRHYQASFLAESDPAEVLRQMSLARRRMQREFHALRMWLPNDAAANRRVVAGIEETDAAMALAMAEVAARFPRLRLAFGAGILQHPTLRAADDVWL
jgi:hypothetical protein